eukprot:3073901-Ditylum_brightwellii.AAC.1
MILDDTARSGAEVIATIAAVNTTMTRNKDVNMIREETMMTMIRKNTMMMNCVFWKKRVVM